jgi:hypothetical protein
MNSHEPTSRDPIDLMIRRALKGWVSGYPLPSASRQELLEKAARSQESRSLRGVLGVVFKGLGRGMHNLSISFAGGPVFEPERLADGRYDYEKGYSQFNLMHLSILNANTPRLGLFSLFM